MKPFMISPVVLIIAKHGELKHFSFRLDKIGEIRGTKAALDF